MKQLQNCTKIEKRFLQSSLNEVDASYECVLDRETKDFPKALTLALNYGMAALDVPCAVTIRQCKDGLNLVIERDKNGKN